MSEGVDIDLRKEFDYMNRHFGMPLLYIRKNTYIKCKCYNELHKCGDPKCKQCLGTGYMNILEPKRGIKGPLSFSQKGFEISSLGKVDTDDVNFYLDFTQQPKKEDLIIQPLVNKKGIIMDLKSVYTIDNIEPVNCDNGRTELYDIVCKIRSDKFVQIRRIISGLTINDRVKLLNGKRVKCLVGDK